MSAGPLTLIVEVDRTLDDYAGTTVYAHRDILTRHNIADGERAYARLRGKAVILLRYTAARRDVVNSCDDFFGAGILKAQPLLETGSGSPLGEVPVRRRGGDAGRDVPAGPGVTRLTLFIGDTHGALGKEFAVSRQLHGDILAGADLPGYVYGSPGRRA